MNPKLTRRDFVKSVTAGAASIGVLQFLPSSSPGADEGAELYHEKYRPQFHFTPKMNWMNDPNGLVYYKGEYHMFFQHNPFGINWGNMTWGHAVSKDLVHWEQLANAIEPDELGTIFSGSAVVDWKNTSGLQTGDENVLVALYTAAGEFAKPEKKKFTQCLAYSNDRGRTWVKYHGNPIVGNIRDDDRDPKVIWHEPTKKWVMVLFLDKDDEFAILISPNLINWEISQILTLEGSRECPDLFPMEIAGNPGSEKWIFRGGNGRYRIGRFDGREFTPESEVLDSVTGNYYAVQTWSDIPEHDGRTLQIAWMRDGEFPGMVFNQQMTIPCELTLRTLPEGMRLCHKPVREIKNIRKRLFEFKNAALEQGGNPLKEITGKLFEIEAEIEIGTAKEITFMLRGTPMVYSCPDKTLTCRSRKISLSPIDGKLKFHILVDRTSIEIFPNEGNMCIFLSFPLDTENESLGVHSGGGQAKATDLKVWTLKSIWLKTSRSVADLSNDGIVNFLDFAMLTGL